MYVGAIFKIWFYVFAYLNSKVCLSSTPAVFFTNQNWSLWLCTCYVKTQFSKNPCQLPLNRSQEDKIASVGVAEGIYDNKLRGGSPSLTAQLLTQLLLVYWYCGKLYSNWFKYSKSVCIKKIYIFDSTNRNPQAETRQGRNWQMNFFGVDLFMGCLDREKHIE